MSNKKRYLIIMVIGVLLNEVFYSVASAYGWPMWLNMSGTALTAIVLEPAAGLLVALVDNFLVSAFKYDASSLLYYSISASVALLAGLNLKKNGKLKLKNLLWVVPAAIICCTVLDLMITMWHGGIPNSLTEQLYYSQMISKGYSSFVSCAAVIFGFKVLDILASVVIVGVTYILLPKGLKHDLSKTKEIE